VMLLTVSVPAASYISVVKYIHGGLDPAVYVGTLCCCPYCAQNVCAGLRCRISFIVNFLFIFLFRR